MGHFLLRSNHHFFHSLFWNWAMVEVLSQNFCGDRQDNNNLLIYMQLNQSMLYHNLKSLIFNEYKINSKINLQWIKRIIWSRFPFTSFKAHYFRFCMIGLLASGCQWLATIRRQLIDIVVFISGWFCFFNRFSIESE